MFCTSVFGVHKISTFLTSFQSLLFFQTDALLWTRSSSVESTLTDSSPACAFHRLAEEPQGEAVAFAPDSSGFYTTSERTFQPIYFYPFIYY